MTLRDLMTSPVIRIQEGESAAVAARTLTRYNIGLLPVCGPDGRLKGVVTDRDLVTRCMAAGKDARELTVGDVMTRQLVTVRADMEPAEAARLMGARQVRRLPVVENERLCGMVSLADLSRGAETQQAAEAALRQISGNVRK